LPLSARWRISQRFRFGHDRTYIFCKLVLDPAYDAVLAELRSAPSFPVLDIGCGPGLLAAVLRTGGLTAPLHGIDYDPRKIEVAREALDDVPDCTFAAGDARTGLPSHCGHVTILDILQFFSPDEVATLLAAAAARVAPGGRLLIRTCLREDGWRFQLTRVGDWIATASAWMKESASHYPSRDALTALLAAAGLTGGIRRLSGRLPFNNYLLSFRRDGE
jgi:2-polyprenyl-3-methyl-5-hydroxy-6-metoxy-1,4-benzoquinol methylase